MYHHHNRAVTVNRSVALYVKKMLTRSRSRLVSFFEYDTLSQILIWNLDNRKPQITKGNGFNIIGSESDRGRNRRGGLWFGFIR
jgi:hypothetical protein